jgi:hypothetical protein
METMPLRLTTRPRAPDWRRRAVLPRTGSGVALSSPIGLVYAVAAAVSGCGADPGMPLIPTPTRSATALPADVPPVRQDGFPNLLADPVTVQGLPRPDAAVEEDAAFVAARAQAAEAAAASIPRDGGAAELRRRGRTHVAETRRAIEAGARPQSDMPPRQSDLPPAAISAPEITEPARALREDDPVPRLVGEGVFTGN